MIALLLCTVAQLAMPPMEAEVTGTVRDAETGRVLVGATVLAVDAGRSATTNEQGRYAISELPAGPQHIAVRSLGHAPYAFHAVVPRHGTLELNVALQRLPTRLPIVEVRWLRGTPGVRGEGAGASEGRSVSFSELSRHPQLSEPDFLRAMSGGDVTVAAETPGGLHVRGGGSDQTAYTIDGVPVFNPYHTSDLMGGWNPDAMDGARLASDLPGASALSSTLQLTSRSPGSRISGRGAWSTSHARVAVDGPLGLGNAAFLLSGRSAWPAALAPEDDPTFIRGRSGDLMAKLEVPLTTGHFRLFVTGSNDRLNLSPNANSAGDSGVAVRRNSFGWNSGAAAAQWRSVTRRGDSLVLAGWRSATSARARWIEEGALTLAADRVDYGAQATLSRTGATFRTEYGARAERPTMTYRVDGDSGTVNALRTTDPLFTLFGDGERTIGGVLGVGARASAVLFNGRMHLAPALRARWSITERLTISGTVARSHQFAQSLRNPESVVGHVFPADLFIGAGHGVLPVARSDELAMAAAFEPAPGVVTRVGAYTRQMEGVAMVAPVEGAPFLRSRPRAGNATATGAFAEGQVTSSRYNMLARYGVQSVRYHLGTSSYVPSFGARHLLDGGVTLFPSTATSVRVGATAALGRRVTPTLGPVEWESCNLRDRGCEFAGSPRTDPAQTGVARAPAYVRVDVSARRHMHLQLGGRSAELAVYGTYSNLLSRFNVLTYGLANGVPEALEMRPQSPLVVGLEWRF
ncbi:MAG: carboxypeptidase-like regulatory domain-containing protein [Gemmatimonadaceae bacterium]